MRLLLRTIPRLTHGCTPAAIAAAAAVVFFVPGASFAATRDSTWTIHDVGAVVVASGLAINERGQLVGTLPTPHHAFLWSGGKVRDLGTLPLGGRLDMPNVSEATAINDDGQVIGTSYVERLDPSYEAFVWTGGKMRGLRCIPRGCDTSDASALNERGEIVGWSGRGTYSTGLVRHAVLWQNGKPRLLGTLRRGWASEALALNERGQVAGISYLGDEKRVRSFIWEHRRIRDLGAYPGSHQTYVSAINDHGQIVGSSGTFGFLWRGGKMTVLSPLRGHHFSGAVDVNDQGVAVGVSDLSQRASLVRTTHAVLWRAGHVRDLGTLGGTWSEARAINDRGQIIGLSATETGEQHAFVWQNGKMIDLGTLAGSKQSSAEAINERGWIVGSSGPGAGLTHAVVWKPG